MQLAKGMFAAGVIQGGRMLLIPIDQGMVMRPHLSVSAPTPP